MKIGNLNLRNNFLMSPVKTGYGDKDGNITERHIAFWNLRSKHVAGVIFEPFFIDKESKELPTQIGIHEDRLIEQHINLTSIVKKNGAFAIAHLNHPGRMANPKISTNRFISASDISCQSIGVTPKKLSMEEIFQVQKLYVDSAIRAEKAGYDMLEIQFGLGYLIAQFLSPNTNKRDDYYGGNFNSRLKFGLEILREIKTSVSLPIIVRISGDEKFDNGLDINFAKDLVIALESEGVNAIHVTSGNVCETPPHYYQHHFIPKGATWELAGQIKKITHLPVITVGQITEFADIDSIYKNNQADIIAFGRTLIADPDFVGKYEQKVSGTVRPCSSCLTGCLGRIKIGKGLQCEINPEVGREPVEIKKSVTVKNYAVIGGGLAGMQAAITLKHRGNNVDIFEKDQLGGQFNYAPLPDKKHSLQKQIDYLIDEIKDIKVIKKTAHENDLIGKYDGVIIATGSNPFIPPISGLKRYSWAEILLEHNIPKDQKVVIIGGGLIGVEIANTLIDYGNTVIIIEMLDDIARDMEMISRKLNLMKIQKTGIQVNINSKVTKIEDRTIFYNKTNGKVEEFKIENVDSLIIAAGMRPENSLEDKLKGKIDYRVVGDALQVGDAVSAIQSAYFTCLEI